MTGKLVVVEGIDGSGKSTMVRDLALGPGFVATREPTTGPHGTALRMAFAAGVRLPLEEERRLFELDRREHLASVIGPALSRGDTVVCDRSYYSTAAYQGTDSGDARRIVLENEAFAPRPDVVIYLELAPAFALARIQARGVAPTAPETYEALRDCAARYECIWADPQLMCGVRLIRIDARASQSEILALARRCLAPFLHHVPAADGDRREVAVRSAQ